MSATVLLALFGVGLAVGVLSGLIGIGGGVLIVPFLYFFYSHPDWSGSRVAPDLAATVAHATSLFIIMPTAVRGTLAYQRSNLVAWRAALPIAAASTIAAVLGARLALILPEHVLKLAFGLLLTWSGIQLARSRAVIGERPAARTPVWKSLATGLLVGLFSALLGVGGGVIAIPLLVYVIGIEVKKVAATSLAIVMFSATAGTITYLLSSVDSTGLPGGTVGYVHVAAALPILVGAVLSVRLGTWLNQQMPTRRLRALFAALFVLLGVRLVVTSAAAIL